MTAVIPTATASPAIVNGVLFPILFISGTFYPVQATSMLGRLASVLPVRHFEQAVFAVFDPRSGGTGIEPWALVGMLCWGLAALAVAVKRFRWEPRQV
jgi:ABC-2 type transport system permease protein